uniref:centrosomal protein of 295 kDa n=1 Tax=Scatophagus argus TaxID=75038 RepID=UPI001ED8071E|nr:centrosomal protein of 295 kDa [Scatophagus argus]
MEKMKRKVSRLRLSPNEEARIIREERERRRKLRIQQVREQQRSIALHIRQEVERRRQHELQQLGEELRRDWEQQQREKLNTLQKLYQESLQLLGQGHRSAKENEPDLAAIAQKEEENHSKAEERFREALKELKSQKLKDHERQSRSINARKKALQAEKERSAKVASLPPPPPNPTQNIDCTKPHVVKKSDVSAFTATHYHMSESTVDRELDPKQPNANEGAELEVRRLEELQKEEEMRREEQLEKARLRGIQALRREHLVQDRDRLLVELEHMQQTDLLRKRQQVSKMPPQIFQPLYKRQETREDFQREMEFAFEDMYTGERRVKGDLVVQLVPEPLPAPSTASQDQELDITQDELDTPGAENTQCDTEQDARSTEQETSVQGEEKPQRHIRPEPRRALKRLLDRIRSQRNQWTEHNRHDPVAESPSDISDQIPERDTTIDTGSLTSEEKVIELPEPAHLPPAALEPAEESAAADTSLPYAFVNKIQQFTEEQRKREEELEREKQQQVVLLQELEEQKAKLEQMLLEAQQEREQLKSAVTQEAAVPVNQPETPVHDQDVTSVPPELVPPPGEDVHTGRVREYQQRLLEQNRIHQRSVEVARQRLEEYQRALQIRHNTMASVTLPTALHPRLVHPPVHSTQALPAALTLPTAAAAPSCIHAKQQSSVQSDTLVSPPRPPASSVRVCSRLLQAEEEPVHSSPRNQRADLSTWLTDSIMERVTEHLPERLRPNPVTREPLPHKLYTAPHSTSIPLQQPSEPIKAMSPSVTRGTPPVPDHAAVAGMLLHGSALTGSLSSREDDMERQRRELQEVQRRMLEQREAVLLQQRKQEEERQKQELELEQMRRQKETLQALILTDAQPVPQATSELSVSQNISQTRLRLLASLLRAIEDTNGGSLSHLEDTQEDDVSLQQPPADSFQTAPISLRDVPAGPSPASALPSGFLPPPRAAKPPVTRVRLGIMEMMTQQHELSAIPEVETPVNTSQVTGLEGSVKVPSHTVNWDPHEESRSSEASDGTLHMTQSSSGLRPAESPAGFWTGSGRPGHLIWRGRLPTGAGTSPESSESELRIMSALSSDSGRGADCSGALPTSCRSPSESTHRPPDSESSTTISTGSYITTDPEQNLKTDESPPLRRGADLLDVSSPSDQSSHVNDSSAAGQPDRAVETLFNDSSIQRIIDRYTRELNISLSTTGKSTDSGGSYVEESSVSHQSLIRVSERREEEEEEDEGSLPSATAGSQRGVLEADRTVSPILEHFSAEDQSFAGGREQDSFRPLIGQLTEQSSCLAADHRDSALERLVGQPSAHSSVIGQLPGLPLWASLDQGGWDSTLSRMIGRLTHQSSSHWLSGGQDFYAGQLMGQMVSEQSTTWLDEGREESRMRPLVGELDESAGQHTGSSGEGTRVDLGVSTEAGVPSDPAMPPEASSHGAPVPGVTPHPQDQTSPVDPGPERTEVFPGSDSFHALLAEVTHNETADPSMTFQLPELSVPQSPGGRPTSWGRNVPTPPEEPEHHRDSSESEPSPERLRTEQPSPPPTSHESFSQLVTSQDHLHDVELTALSLSTLTLCEDTPAPSEPQPEEPISDECTGEPERLSYLRIDPAISEKTLEAAGEKGILEQSEITLVSLTDTTLQDPETTVTDEDQLPHGLREDGQGGLETEATVQGTESTLLQHETPEDKNQTHPVTLLQFQWGPSGGLQEEACQRRRRALLQRSSHRVEEIKARRTRVRIHPEIQAGGQEQSEAQASQVPLTCKAKTRAETQHKSKTKSEGGQAEQHQTDKRSGFSKQRKFNSSASDSRLKKVDEVKLCTPEQRKLDVSEMQQRTQRLYEQLEEVKRQKAIRSRQEAYAQNRLKAKEFHKKTLEKLRAKQTVR